jgi:hypothetical protein
MQTKAFAAQSGTTPLAETLIDRRAVGPTDVAIDIALLRRVPFGPAHRARRMGRRALPVRAGA